MCRLLMNNEFRKITIIALSQVDVSKKYKMNTGACQLLYTGAFLRPMGTAQIPIPMINLSVFVRYCAPVLLCETTHQ